MLVLLSIIKRHLSLTDVNHNFDRFHWITFDYVFLFLPADLNNICFFSQGPLHYLLDAQLKKCQVFLVLESTHEFQGISLFKSNYCKEITKCYFKSVSLIITVRQIIPHYDASFVQFWFRIDRVIVEKDVLAQKWAIHDSNDFFFFFFFLHFEKRNILFKLFCFEFLTIPKGFNLFRKKDNLIFYVTRPKSWCLIPSVGVSK
jgi:hypothetical protein